MLQLSIIFLSTFVAFLFFLTPNVNTGDAGDLITSSYYLGLAHPSGYPLYLLVAKTLTFLPFGNIAFKAALASALFNSLSLTLLYWLIFRLTRSRVAGFFATALLLVSYSFFTQSVVAKFYALNLFLILSICVACIFLIKAEEKPPLNYNAMDNEQTQYLTAFLFGLITANHHTGVLLFAPVFLALLANKTSIKLKTILIAILLFFAGFIINAYLFLRGGEDRFFTISYVRNLSDFYGVFFRQVYGGGGTLTVATSAFQKLPLFWNAVKNFIFVLTANFTLFSFPLFFAGIYLLLKRERKILLFMIAGLFVYGPFLAKLTLSEKNVSERDYYIIAHQYFIPALAFYVFFVGIGFYQTAEWLKKLPMKLLPKALPVIFAFFPLVFLVSRATDSNYKTNYVPYQLTKDMYSVLPVDSVFLTFGDDQIFQSFYLKEIGRYRDDTCQLAAAATSDAVWKFQGCNRRIYGSIFPAVYTKNVKNMVPLMLKNRFYSPDVVTKDFPFSKYLYNRAASLIYEYLPKKPYLENQGLDESGINRRITDQMKNSGDFINYNVCLEHFTDDYITRANHCMRYFTYLLEFAKVYSDKGYGKTGERLKFTYVVTEDQKEKDIRSYDIAVTERNRPYLTDALDINKHNDWKLFYIRRQEQEDKKSAF